MKKPRASKSEKELKRYHRDGILRWVLFALGTLSLAFGIVGIFIPLLPTTPFFLAAAWCYMRSSARAYRWMRTNRYIGKYITNYLEKRGMTARAKVVTLALLWGTIILFAFFMTTDLVIRTVLIVVGSAVTAHILILRTAPGTVGIAATTERHSGERRQ